MTCKLCQFEQGHSQSCKLYKEPKFEMDFIDKEIYELAQFMHDDYEDYAKKVGWKSQKKCQTLFDELPPANKEVMLWVAKSVKDKIEKRLIEEIEKEVSTIPKYDLSKNGIAGEFYLKRAEVLKKLQTFKNQK